MGKDSKIEWTHHTFNPWRGCAKISPGCAHCYAETLSHRNPGTLGVWGDNGTRVVASESYWRQPLKWDREAKGSGGRRRVFCASLADVFEDRDELHAPRTRLFRLIEATPSLDWLLLTKRPNIALEFDEWFRLTPNVWLGVSVEDQARADERIPHLLRTSAAVRFLSCEPLLGPVDLERVVHRLGKESSMTASVLKADDGFGLNAPRNRINWVIVGGESGQGARPMNPAWARSIRDQCAAAGVAFHFKQWGEIAPEEQVPGLYRRPIPDHMVGKIYWPFKAGQDFGPAMVRVGKKAAGRVLDGRTWDEFPATGSGVT